MNILDLQKMSFLHEYSISFFFKNEYLFCMNILDSKKINNPFEYIFWF